MDTNPYINSRKSKFSLLIGVRIRTLFFTGNVLIEYYEVSARRIIPKPKDEISS